MDILSGEESEEEQFAINDDYAKNYNKWRPAEHLQRLKDKYGKNPEEEEEDSDESSEDEDAQDLTPEVEKDFFKTLSSLKKKDPKIYDGKTEFFKKGEKMEGKEKKEKPVRIGDIERKVMVEKGGKFDDMEDENLAEQSETGKTYVEEMSDIKKGFKIAIGSDEEESDDDEEEGLLVKREKTKEEKKVEDEEYKSWLAGQKDDLEDENVANELGELRDYWNSSKLDKGEKFLRDYILNKGYIEDDTENYVPTYDEVVHDSDEGLSEDEENIKKQEEFEVKFNFRSEEPDEDFIKRYPRTFKDSMRKKDERRKVKRKEVEERKEKEKEKKKEELKFLKAMKRDEILEKLDKLRKITGNKDMDFKDEDIEADFDPEEYDKRMQNVFKDYDGDAAADEDGKPIFSDLDDDDFDEDHDAEDWDNWTGPKGDDDVQPNCEDEDFNMDCDYDENAQSKKEIIESTKGRKKSRRKSKFAEAIENTQDKPVFNPDEKTFEEYVDEYYKLDCEDIIGDLPCRFKYRKVEPNDFGLSCDEILNAKDPELNAWVSLRKSCQYRSEAEEKHDVHVYRNKGKNSNLKKKVLPSLFETKEEQEEEEGEGKTAKKKRKKKKKKTNVGVNEDLSGGSVETSKDTSNESEDKNKKRKLNTQDDLQTAKKVKVDATSSQNATVGGEGKKKRKKKKKNPQNQQQGSSISLQGVAAFYNKSNGINKKKSFQNKAGKGAKDKETFTADRLKAYGINPRKFKKEKYRKMDEEKKKMSAAK